jgi:preprotein translocase subunit SecE
LSSQQQSQGYKRRSSGKRTRRVTQSTTAPVEAVEQGSPSTEDAGTTTQVTERPVARSQSRPAATSPAGTRTRGANRTATTEGRGSRLQSVVNTERFSGQQKFIREAWAEIKKVIWPDRETTRNLTLVVIAVSVVLGILLGGIDFVLFQLFEALP